MWYLPRPRTPPCTVLKRNKKIKMHKNETKPNPETDTETETELRLEKNSKQWKPNWAAQSSGSGFPHASLSLSLLLTLYPILLLGIVHGSPAQKATLINLPKCHKWPNCAAQKDPRALLLPSWRFYTYLTDRTYTLPSSLPPFAQRDQDELSLLNSENCNAKIP